MRYTDTNIAIAAREDFAVRRRLPTLAHFAVVVGAGWALMCAAYAISGSFVEFSLMCLPFLGALSSILVWSAQRDRDLLLVTEFQNALYSSALSVNSRFCLIVRKDGSIVHHDAGFSSMYPRYDRMLHRSIDDVMQLAHVGKEESEKLYALLAGQAPAQHVLSLRDGDGIAHKVMLSIDPIRRPRDYVLLRGRPYVEQRGAAA